VLGTTTSVAAMLYVTAT